MSSRVDLGTNETTPLVFTYEKRQSGIVSRIVGDTIEPALLMLAKPERVIETLPTIRWIDLYQTGKVNAMHLVCGEWGTSLTRETAKKLGVTMLSLIETGLTWNAIALSHKQPDWFVSVIGATSLDDFAMIPGDIPVDTLNWTQDDIEDALGIPFGSIETDEYDSS